MISRAYGRRGSGILSILRISKSAWRCKGTAVIAIMVACCMRAQADPPADTADAAIATVIKALESRRHMESGSGLANVSVTEGGKVKETLVEFRFSGLSSRSEVFDAANGQRGEFQVSWAENPKITNMLNPFNAAVQIKHQGQFHRRVGYDFHPATYERLFDRPLEDLLRRVMSNPETTKSTMLDGAGILHIRNCFSDSHSHEELEIALDSRMEYRLVSAWWSSSDPTGPESSTFAYALNWVKRGSVWCVMNAILDRQSVSIESDGSVRTWQETTRIEVSRLDEKPVPALDFTLKGLGVPLGTRVVDEVAGFMYMYKGVSATDMDEDDAAETQTSTSPAASAPHQPAPQRTGLSSSKPSLPQGQPAR